MSAPSIQISNSVSIPRTRLPPAMSENSSQPRRRSIAPSYPWKPPTPNSTSRVSAAPNAVCTKGCFCGNKLNDLPPGGTSAPAVPAHRKTWCVLMLCFDPPRRRGPRASGGKRERVDSSRLAVKCAAIWARPNLSGRTIGSRVRCARLLSRTSATLFRISTQCIGGRAARSHEQRGSLARLVWNQSFRHLSSWRSGIKILPQVLIRKVVLLLMRHFAAGVSLSSERTIPNSSKMRNFSDFRLVWRR